MTDHNTKTDKLNTDQISIDNQSGMISDTLSDTVQNTYPDTDKNISDPQSDKLIKNNPARNGGTLISLADRTLEERREIGRKGGLKSGETKRQRKTMKETILSMLSQELSLEKIEEFGIDPAMLNGDYTMQGAVIAAMFREAMNGSEKAAVLLRDTINEAPALRQEIQQEIITKEDTDLMDSLKQSLIS